MTTEEIKMLLYNIFGVEFNYTYTSTFRNFYSTKPSIVIYYYESYIAIDFNTSIRNYIKQKLINSKDIYEYNIYSNEGVAYLCNDLKNIDI